MFYSFGSFRLLRGKLRRQEWIAEADQRKRSRSKETLNPRFLIGLKLEQWHADSLPWIGGLSILLSFLHFLRKDVVVLFFSTKAYDKTSFSKETFAVGTQWKRLNETLPMSTTTKVFIKV